MPDIFELIQRWWKYMVVTVVVSVMLVGTIMFLKPGQYLSVATAVPANAYTTDKSAIFNENIQSLYSSLGVTDDLDRLLGTGELDTVYLAVNDRLNLAGHYRLGEDAEARVQAAAKLKSNSKVVKSGYGELKVKVWDVNKNIASEMANQVMKAINEIHQSVQNEANVATLLSIKAGKQKLLKELDSLSREISYDSTNTLIRSQIIPDTERKGWRIRRDALFVQLTEYEKLINQYQLMVDSKQAVLYVVETARPGQKPDRPKRLQTIIATAVLSLLFSLLLALVLDRKKTVHS